jgi:hypothetical protein
MKSTFSILLGFVFCNLLSQQTFQLDQKIWQFDVPFDFQMETYENDSLNLSNSNQLISVYKNPSDAVNKISVTYGENQNMKKLTTEIYVFSLVDLYKKAYNNTEFMAKVEMERKKISNHVFYLIRSTITHLESEYIYVSDTYTSELNEKEFSVNITYDNDDDKFLLEQSFLNSRFL